MSVSHEHCQVIEPLGGSVDQGSLQGDALDINLRQYRRGEATQGGLDGLGEEVATVISGEFDVDAAGEHYRLTPGEGILIPRGEPRKWTCTSAEGVLYRAVVRGGPQGRERA